MDKLPPFDKIGANPVPDFVNADPTNSVQGSIVNGLIFNQLQNEGVSLLRAGGLAPDSTIISQWAQSLSRGVWLGPFTGTGDLPVGTLGCVFPALLQGMRVRGVTTAANTVTNPKLRVFGIGSPTASVDFPILKEDGSSLAIGEMQSGKRYTFEADGAGNVMISGGGIGSGASSSTINTIINAAPVNALLVASAANSIPNSSAGSPSKITAWGAATNNLSGYLTWDSVNGRVNITKAIRLRFEIDAETNLPLGNYGIEFAIGKNGSSTALVASNQPSTSSLFLGITPNLRKTVQIPFAAGDYLDFFFGQNSGSTISVPFSLLIQGMGQ